MPYSINHDMVINHFDKMGIEVSPMKGTYKYNNNSFTNEKSDSLFRNTKRP